MDIDTINQLALLEAKKSKCFKRKVGAIIVSAEGRNGTKLLAKGHNYLPNNIGLFDCEDAEGNTRPEVVHAEIAAISKIKNRETLTGGKIYVTFKPCNNCQKAINELGLEAIIVESFMKFDAGKLRYGLIPPKANKELAKVLTYGAKKYKANNWQEVDDTDRYIDALYRHLESWRAGEKVDEESGLSHLSHAMANIAFLIHFEDIK